MKTHDWKYIACDPIKCTGCGICELACSLEKDKRFNPLKSRIRTVRTGSMKNFSLACMLCEDAYCVAACPEEALEQSKETGLIKVDKYKCVARQGCCWCIHACPYGAMALDPERKITIVCDLCDGKPKCVDMCPKATLELVARDDFEAQKTRILNLVNLKAEKEPKIASS